MKTFKVFSDPKAFEVLADETRRRMIYLLRAKELTVSQLAAELDKTPQAIYHQIKILLEGGFVEVAREERVEHFIETYYRATAEVFEFRHGESQSGSSRKQLKEVLEVLPKLGFQIDTTDEMVSKVEELDSKINMHGGRPDLEEKIQQMEDAGFFTRQHAYYYAQLAMMTDKQFNEMVEATKELRELISSTLVKPPKKNPAGQASAPQ